MKIIYVIVLLSSFTLFSQKTIHTFVALCDNVNQGIVPVPKNLGNGQDARNNLYWGALYGVKTHFKKSEAWELIKVMPSNNSMILERILFKHKTSNTYLLADAYDGKYIKECTIDMLKAAAGDFEVSIKNNNSNLKFGSASGLISYIGHNGLMEFEIDQTFTAKDSVVRDVIILACYSQGYFDFYLKQTKANPLVWTTNLMAPEAYTLKWAIDGWIKAETNEEIRSRAAKAYHYYQKCGIKGARRLLVTGY